MLNKQQAKELLAKIIQTIKMHLYILEPGKEERFICEVSSAITDMEKLVDLYLEEQNVDLENLSSGDAVAYAIMFVLSDNIEEFEIFSEPEVFYNTLNKKCGKAGKKFYKYIENGHNLYQMSLEEAAEYVNAA